MQNSRVNFEVFTYIWFKTQNQKLPKHQRSMAKWLYNIFTNTEERQALLMAFRNSGKSTIVGLFCAFVLYQNQNYRILVLAADHALAKKMVRNVKRIIERHPLTRSLKPNKLDQWASDQFTINREHELRDPSMLAKGITANITGLRADLIICDDVEVPKNCDTKEKREILREKLGELDYILTPFGMQLYIGTPHTCHSIYQTSEDENKKEQDPFLLNFKKLEIPVLSPGGKSNWEERFPLFKIASIRARSGENKFLSQMMLKPVNFRDSILSPDNLRAYKEELNLLYANGEEVLKLSDKRLVSSSCWWDPSFGGKKNDSSVIACVFTDTNGKLYLHDIEYIKVPEDLKDSIATFQCEKVISFLERNFLPSITIEANGIGKFLPSILRSMLKERGLGISVIEHFSASNKQQRILEAFEVLLAEKSLYAHAGIWQTPFIEEMREWHFETNNTDDGLDAVSGCLLGEPVRIRSFGNRKLKRHSWRCGNKSFIADY